MSPAGEPLNDAHTSPTNNRRGFFGRRHASADSIERDGSVASNRSLGRNASVMSGGNSDRSGGGGFFKRNMGNFDVHKDPTIMAARDKVTTAENAEAEADRALMQARAMVREAKDHIHFLEREAAEEAKRATAKQAESHNVSKSAAGLGRHGP
ncbi:hypothetical protein B0H10DRAFT_1774475 [Mycena sp. CBHHK59/15]|nr:hypothetical protein B0H10DRAFT_1774475 [Mycena sp. CBHHK59/15]